MTMGYVSGPLTGLKNIKTMKAFYARIGEVLISCGIQPYIPHLHSDPILNHELSPQDVYGMDRYNVTRANLLVAYVGIPSLGVGQEIEIAREYSIPIYLMYEADRLISRMTLGNPAVKAEIVGTCLDDILKQLEHLLKHQNSFHRHDEMCLIPA